MEKFIKQFKEFKKSLTFAFVLCLLFIFAGCNGNIGLGEYIDLEAPEVQVKEMITVDENGNPVAPKTSFETTLYTKQKVTFSGYAYDNNKLSGVYAEVKWLNDEDYHYLKPASLDGNKWTLDINFEKEGACWLKFIAEDKSKNYGIKSSKVVTLFVDNDPPVIGEAWYIDRKVNGIQYSLQGLDSLVAILAEDPNLTNPSNKDVAQNGEFYICGSLTDATGIADDELYLSLYECEYDAHGNPVIDSIPIRKKTNISKDAEESTSNYAPKFKINGEELGLPSSGKHYYQIRYSAKDMVTDPAPNIAKDKELEMGWFLWWPESDFPRYSISNIESGSTSITVHTGDSLNITVFDDDALKKDSKVKCELKGKSTETEEETIKSDTERDCNIILKAPSKPQSMTLEITATDTNGKTLSHPSITVFVTDDFKPTAIITSPEDKQIPNVTGDNGDIHFSGITLDKSGCTSLEFVWVPDSVTQDENAKKIKAQEILDSITNHSTYAPTGDSSVKATTVNGCVIWSAKLSNAGTEGSFQKHSFDFDISLLNDFGTEKNKNKFFVARLSREDGVFTDTELKLAADDLAPEIEVISPGGNMSIVDKDVDLNIEFHAKKSSGVRMDTSKYKLTSVDKNEELAGTYDSVRNLYTYKVPKADLSAFDAAHKNPKFKFEAQDVLGNSSSVEYQYIISALPQIKAVTSSAPEKCKKGDEILINVSFTKPVSCSEEVYLKLKGIKNESKAITVDNVVPAKYHSGSGSTTLIFKYKVQDGDISDGLLVYNESGVGPIYGLSEASVHLKTLTDENNLQAKRSANPIKINGIAPKVSSVKVECTDVDSTNIVDNVKYLKAGRTITVTVMTNKKVKVQGTPKFKLKSGADSLDLSWQSITDSGTGSKLVFTKRIEANTSNNQITFNKNTCFDGTQSVIRDEYGNELVIDNASTDTVENLVIDTQSPLPPTVTKSDGSALESGPYANSVSFKVNPNVSSGVRIQYSKNGGNRWESYTDSVTLLESASLVARVVDYAGNISNNSAIIELDINNTFPDFTVECTNSDGRYQKDAVLEFKVSFVSPVKIDVNSAASISLSALTGTITSGAKAVITNDSKNKTRATEARFEYIVQEGDDFTLKVSKDAINLNGIEDLYGIPQGAKKLAADYSRANLYCDTVLPTVLSMLPDVAKTSQNNLNAYANGKKITLTFSEPVNVVSGKIYLRQASGWAIPPMLTATEFNKVLSAVSGVTVTSNGKTLTGSQVLYMDGMEDAENLYSSLTGAANDRYHGTAQYVGPYKKMTNGINDNGTPNLDVKYVLDFGVDIWNSDDSTKINFGLTFEPNWTPDGQNKAYNQYHHVYQKGWVNVVTPETVITTDTIRAVLEKAHFHERYMNVNSTYVEASADRKTYTLNFPEGLLGDSDLPLGREWELVIDQGAFMDDTGNYITGTLTSDEKILVQEGSGATKKNTFMSAGVAKPVIRVDHYSYGLGIKQPVSISGNTITYEQIDVKSTASGDCIAGNGTHVPSAKVAVKIDCESKVATIRYAMKSISKTNGACSTTPNRTDKSNEECNIKSYASTTAAYIPVSATDDARDTSIGNQDDERSETKGTGSVKVKFLAGSGDYTKSIKQYITADATVNSGALTSVLAKEGIFQTVVNINNPIVNKGGRFKKSVNGVDINDSIWQAGDGKQVVNIHGTTGFGGVPSISPFPLRDQAVASAYMRQTYQKENQYYWLSYETLVDGLYSMYAYGRNAWNNNNFYGTGNSRHWGDWAKGYASYITGEYNRVDDMESYLAYDDATDYNDASEYVRPGAGE